MKRIDTANRSVDMFGPGRDGFATAVAGVSQPTYLSAQFCNAIQEALVRVIERAGLIPSDDYNQFAEAVASVTEAQALLAAAARMAAESARDAAIIGAGVYVDEPTGRAAVVDGAAFKVQGSGDVAAFEYRRTSSAASVLIAAYPSAVEKISPARTSFLIPGKNLFDKSRVTRGKYLTETGVLADNPVYDVSDFIAVTPGQTYHANAQGMRFTSFSDINRVLVAGGSDIGLNPFVAPAGAAYVRVTMFHSDIDQFQFERGDEATAYEPFYYQLRLASGVKIVPPAESMPNGWLPPEKTSFLQVGKNRFNRRTVTVGRYIVATGALLENPAYDTSDYIPVRPGVYTCNMLGIRFSCNYDENKNVILGGYDGAVSVGTLVIPDGVAFIRIAVAHDSASLQLEEGKAPTGFEQYGLYFRGENNTPIHVTPLATNFLQVGKNLFSHRTVTVGRYLTPGGVEAENSLYDYSDYIPVEPGTYVLNGPVVRMTCLFSEQRTVVPGGYDESLLVDRFTIPSGVAFIRITVPHYGVEAIQLERGNVSTTFEEYRYELRAADGTPIAVDGAGTGSPGTPAMEAPVLATTHYVPAGKELALYYENIVRDFQAHAGHIGISSSLPDTPDSPTRETGEARKLLPLPGQVNTVVGGSATVVGSSFDFVAGAAGKWYQVKITDPANTTPVNIQNIGDSFSGRMTWVNVLNATPAANGITYSGNRTANSTNQVVKCEGQGGWTMESYFTVDNRGYLSPFMHPVNAGLKYFGPTSFWIDANSASPSYNASYFFGVRDGFSPTTGRKLVPAVGDVMSEAGGYITWDGANWVPLNAAALGGFVFSYARYRAVWGIPRPDILHVLLGTNDFYGADGDSFAGIYATYKARYEQLIASVQADSPACKVIVGIPVSSGRQGEYGTLTTERVKRAMWSLAKALNADFGEREAEGIYVLDYHSIVHRVYGFDSTPEKPGADYGGTDTYKYTTDHTHCSLFGFDQMGNAYMGLVQYLRSLVWELLD